MLAAPMSLDRACQGLQCILLFLQIDSDILRCLLNKCVSEENQSRTDSRMPLQVPSHGSVCSRALLKVFLQSFFLGTLLWSAAELGKSSKAEQEREDQTVLVSDGPHFFPFVVFPSLSFAQLNSNLLTTVVGYHCKLNLFLCEVKVNMTERKIHAILAVRLMTCPPIIFSSDTAIIKFSEKLCCSVQLTRMQ